MVMYDPSANGFADGSCDETRQCIRALVTVIRQAQGGSSPVDNGQLAHMRKVVRLLSLSDQQLDEMPPDEREAVISIRCARIARGAEVSRGRARDPLMLPAVRLRSRPVRPRAGEVRFRR